MNSKSEEYQTKFNDSLVTGGSIEKSMKLDAKKLEKVSEIAHGKPAPGTEEDPKDPIKEAQEYSAYYLYEAGKYLAPYNFAFLSQSDKTDMSEKLIQSLIFHILQHQKI